MEVLQGNIVEENTDAITNPAANTHLHLGGGIGAKIREAGGFEIQTECDEYIKKNGDVMTGSCTSTGPGKLQCKYIIHTVGPAWDKEISA